MRKIFIILIFFLFGIQPIYGEPSYIKDELGMLSTSQYDHLQEMLAQNPYSTEMDMHILIQNDAVEDIDAYARQVYLEQGFGVGQDHDGLFLLITLQDRSFSFTVHGEKTSRIFIAYIRQRIMNDVVYYLSSDHFYEAFSTWIKQVEDTIDLAVQSTKQEAQTYGYFRDESGYITKQEGQQIEAALQQFQKTTHQPLYLTLINSNIEHYSSSRSKPNTIIYDLGTGNFLFDQADRHLTHWLRINTIDQTLSDLDSDMLKTNSPSASILNSIDYLRSAFFFKKIMVIAIVFLTPPIALLILFYFLIKKHQQPEIQIDAQSYIAEQMMMDVCTDTFTHRTKTIVPRIKNDPPSGGSSHHFTSSSGSGFSQTSGHF